MITTASALPVKSGASNRNSYDRMGHHQSSAMQRELPQPHSMQRSGSSNNINNNTTKVLITNGSNNDMPSSYDNNYPSNRNSATYLGEQALKMLADLKSSSC